MVNIKVKTWLTLRVGKEGTVIRKGMMAAPGGAGEVSFLDLDGSYKGCNIFVFFTLSNV